MTNKSVYVYTLLGVIAFVAILGGYIYPQNNVKLGAVVESAAGTSNSSLKQAQLNITLATTTTYAYLNSGSTDWEINEARIQIAGQTSTTTTFTVQCATSTSASSLSSNTNYILSTVLSNGVYGTTTGSGLYIASSSPGLTGTTTASVLVDRSNAYVRNWTVGTYMVCQVTTADSYNAFTTGATGFISFPYNVE